MYLYRGSVLSDDSGLPPTSFVSPTFSHISTYRFMEMELQLYSPSIKPHRGLADGKGTLPVFGERDQVKGKVILGRSCYHTGCLSISIEGALLYTPAQVGGDHAEYSGNTVKRKHVFFSSSTILRISPGSDSGLSRFPFRRTFTRRRPSVSSLDLNVTSTERSFPFSFELPSGYRFGEEMPPSFTGSLEPESSLEPFDIIYNIKIIWEAHNHFDNAKIFEVPILFCPHTDFQSIDAVSYRRSWLEMPLTCDRSVPFRCAVTLPSSITFTRTSSVPYFVVFKTILRSVDMAKEIASDATISVSLLRQVVVTEGASLRPSSPCPPTSSHDASRSYKRSLPSGYCRTAKPAKRSDNNSDFRDKSLPRLPTHAVFSESRTVQNSICIGFPKRPRRQICNPGGHPSLDSQVSLPDGLHKGIIQLHEGMLPSIDWAGVSVKYYLDVSVLVGQDDLRARIPIRLV